MSKRENIRGTSIIVSLKRDEILQVGRLTGDENFVREINLYRYCMRCSIFSQ